MTDNAEPERLDRFMARANAAYYAGRDPFADFITAPEIAQQFGELIGAWAAVMWQAMGRPDPVLLCEAGPGRGTLMADALRLVRRVAPDFASAARLHLVETSPRLRAIQADALPGADPTWHDTVDTLPDAPLILIGNEFLDALPIRQLVRTPEGWRERFVQDGAFVLRAPELSPADPKPAPVSGRQLVHTPEGWRERFVQDGTFVLRAPELSPADPEPAPVSGRQLVRTPEGWRERFVQDGTFVLRAADLAPADPEPASKSPHGSPGATMPDAAAFGPGSADPEQVVERCEPALAIVAALAARIVRTGGAVLLLDYGPDRPCAGDTLQALRDGQPASPLQDPGSADLTAHVDFPSLRQVALDAGAAVHGPEGQGVFLTALGLFQRTERLARGRPPEQAAALLDAAHRLAAPERMGRLFKAMALCHPSLGVPPGFPPGSTLA